MRCLLLLALLLVTAPVGAQTLPYAAPQLTTDAAPPPMGYVVVTAPDGVVLVENDLAQAFTPGDAIPVRPGVSFRLTLTDELGTWDPRHVSTTVRVMADDTLHVSLALPDRHRVETLPLRSLVLLETMGTVDTLGIAPLTVDLPAGTEGTLIAVRHGYQSARIALGASDGGHVLLALRPEGLDEAAPVPVSLLPTQRSGLRRSLIDIGLGAATLAAGAVAVHYKFRADSVDDVYRDPASAQRGSEELRKEADRLDNYSGMALGVMQLGLGVLAIRFVLR